MEPAKRITTEGAVIARQLCVRRKIKSSRGGVAKIKAARIVAVIKEASVVGAHHPSGLSNNRKITILQHEILKNLVLRKFIDNIVEALMKLPNDGLCGYEFVAKKAEASAHDPAFGKIGRNQ